MMQSDKDRMEEAREEIPFKGWKIRKRLLTFLIYFKLTFDGARKIKNKTLHTQKSLKINKIPREKVKILKRE